MQKITDTLKSIGLNDKEINIYIASLSIGETTASILWNKTNIARSTAQFTCNSLVEKRLMNTTPKWNSFLYSPEPPEKIISLINKEYTHLEKKMKNAHQIMWYLNSIANVNAKLPKVKYYTWVDGIIDILEDVFNEKNEFYWVFNYIEDIHPELDKYIKEIYLPKRIKTKIPWKFLVNNNKTSKEYIKNDEKINRITMSIPKELFPFSIWIHIYSNNKVALYSMWRFDMTWVIIENENIKNSIFSMFKLAWNYARTLKWNELYKNIEI